MSIWYVLGMAMDRDTRLKSCGLQNSFAIGNLTLIGSAGSLLDSSGVFTEESVGYEAP